MHAIIQPFSAGSIISQTALKSPLALLPIMSIYPIYRRRFYTVQPLDEIRRGGRLTLLESHPPAPSQLLQLAMQTGALAQLTLLKTVTLMTSHSKQ